VSKRKNKGKGVRAKKARIRNPKRLTAKAEAKTPKAELRRAQPSILDEAMRLGTEPESHAITPGDPFDDTLPLNTPVPAEASPPECIEDVYL